MTTALTLRGVEAYTGTIARTSGVDVRLVWTALSLVPVEVVHRDGYGAFLVEARVKDHTGSSRCRGAGSPL